MELIHAEPPYLFVPMSWLALNCCSRRKNRLSCRLSLPRIARLCAWRGRGGFRERRQ